MFWISKHCSVASLISSDTQALHLCCSSSQIPQPSHIFPKQNHVTKLFVTHNLGILQQIKPSVNHICSAHFPRESRRLRLQCVMHKTSLKHVLTHCCTVLSFRSDPCVYKVCVHKVITSVSLSEGRACTHTQTHTAAALYLLQT